jgi:hypothetical protein
LLRCKPRASASDAALAFIHVPIASQRMSLAVAPTSARLQSQPRTAAAASQVRCKCAVYDAVAAHAADGDHADLAR